MTNNANEALAVTQADREAAASGFSAWISTNPVVLKKMLAGLVDDHSMIQAFARHRIASERADIIAHMLWWESQGGDKEGGWLGALIGQIENGEHVGAAALASIQTDPNK